MGLDMYLEGRKSIYGDKRPTEDGYPVERLTLELGYWRKHPNLHGYIVRTYANGKDECQDIVLDADAIRDIINAVKTKRLPLTKGFFFGHSNGSETPHDLEVFIKALAWLEAIEKPPELAKIDLPGVGFMVEVNPETIPKQYREIVYRASW